MLAKTRHDLEWELLLGQVAAECRSRAGADRVRALSPEESLAGALERAHRLDEALRLAALGSELPVVTVEDLGPFFQRLLRGATATGTELCSLGTVLGAAKGLGQFAQGHAEHAPRLDALLTGDPALDRLRDTLDEAIEPDGTVGDRASPELARARRRVREVRRDLIGRIEQLLTQYQEVLRDRYWAERDGRYVLPVRSDAHFRVPGIVLGSSASGGTLYVEPQEITPLGNRLSVCQADVERAELRVLTELTERVRAAQPAIARAFEQCLEADVLAAAVRWAALTQAHAVLPTAEPSLRLIAVRHPLLIGGGRVVVPNDLELDAGHALIISGPNAGGKTVALKVLGLAAWMVRSGLPIPASPDSVVGWFDPVLTDIGDEQSLSRSLSTYSAQVTNLSSILAVAGPHTLVLLDEVVGGTDPEEGAALATAVLEALVDRGAAVAVTTHYERLKERAYQDGRFVNASVGFDWTTMAPSFRLTFGVPGPSSALTVASRFGVPEPVVQRAQALLPEKSLEREDLVQKLRSEREALAGSRAEVEQQARQQAELTRQLEAERLRARAEEREQLAREAQELMAGVRQARAELRAVVSQLRQAEVGRGQIGELGRRINRAAEQVAVGSDLMRALGPPLPDQPRGLGVEDLTVGKRLYLPRLGTTVEVAEPPQGKQLRVRAGGMKLWVSIDEVRTGPAPKGCTRAKTQPTPRSRQSAAVSAFVPVRTKGNTLDLRGERVEGALDLVDAFLDRLTTAGEPAGFVLHGHGTGKLKAAVREHLSRSTYVERSRPADADDGGDALTVFWLRS